MEMSKRVFCDAPCTQNTNCLMVALHSGLLSLLLQVKLVLSWKYLDLKYRMKQQNGPRNERLITNSYFYSSQVFFFLLFHSWVKRLPWMCFFNWTSWCFPFQYNIKEIRHIMRWWVSITENCYSTDVKLPLRLCHGNNKTHYLFSEKANCKLEVIVIQLSFHSCGGKQFPRCILFLYSVFVSVFGIFTVSYHKWIISGLEKVCCKSLMEDWLIYSYLVLVNNQFAVLEFHWRRSELRLHCAWNW